MLVLNAQWQDWLSTNAARGCSPESMLTSMMEAGFDAADALAAVQGVGGMSGMGVRASAAVSKPGTYRYDAAPVANGNLIHAVDRDIKVLLRCERPQVMVFGEVLSPDECREMIERCRSRLTRSTTVNPQNGWEDVIAHRTSEGVWFQRCEDSFIERLDRRIASLMNWPLENGEGLQILNYKMGGEYRPHLDYFPPDQIGSTAHTAHGGQRTATLIVYLNDVPDGGDTWFPDAGISVACRQGGAVYFRYLNSERQLDPLTLHAGLPVLSGEKWIMTKWMRERPHV
jgi:prolyl 4-hydroxylase